jgi:excinuclease UvrABC ATPase subunit
MENSFDDMMDFIENTLESGSEVSNDKSNPIGLRSDKMVLSINLTLQQKTNKINIAFCLNHLKSFIESEEFVIELVPLRLTVRGVAGSGKITLINTLVTSILRICQRFESVW